MLSPSVMLVFPERAYLSPTVSVPSDLLSDFLSLCYSPVEVIKKAFGASSATVSLLVIKLTVSCDLMPSFAFFSFGFAERALPERNIFFASFLAFNEHSFEILKHVGTLYFLYLISTWRLAFGSKFVTV